MTVPVAIHLDHGSSFEIVQEAIRGRLYIRHDRCFIINRLRKTLQITKSGRIMRIFMAFPLRLN